MSAAPQTDRPECSARAGRSAALSPTTRALAYASLAALYAVQALTPLRLNTDAVQFLQIAAAFADGRTIPRSHYPPGYPIAVATLDRLGIASSATLVLLNITLLAVALVGQFALFRRWGLTRSEAQGSCAMAAMSFVYVKHVSLPVSDTAYFGVASLALVLMMASRDREGRRKVLFMAMAALATAMAIAIRTVGIALLPPLIYAGTPPASPRKFGRALMLANRARLALAVGTASAGVLVAAWLLTRTIYFRDLVARVNAQGGVWHSMARVAQARLIEFGELTINIPIAKLGAAAPLAYVVGAAAVVLMALGCRDSVRRRFIGPPEIYALSYIAILTVWPFLDTRFWLPLIPILGYWAALGAARVATRPVRRAYVAWYLAAGAVALLYSTRLTLSGSKFPQRFGGGSFQAAYLRASSGDSSLADPAAALIRRYGKPLPP